MRKRHQQCEKHYISTVQNIPSWQQNGGPFLPVFLQKETGHHFLGDNLGWISPPCMRTPRVSHAAGRKLKFSCSTGASQIGGILLLIKRARGPCWSDSSK